MTSQSFVAGLASQPSDRRRCRWLVLARDPRYPYRRRRGKSPGLVMPVGWQRQPVSSWVSFLCCAGAQVVSNEMFCVEFARRPFATTCRARGLHYLNTGLSDGTSAHH